MSGVGPLFITSELMIWKAFAGSLPGHAIGSTPAALNFSIAAMYASQSAGTSEMPAVSAISVFSSGMLKIS